MMRLAAVLPCKSIVKFGYRGGRLIEPSSSLDNYVPRLNPKQNPNTPELRFFESSR